MLHHDDLKAENTEAAPGTIKPETAGVSKIQEGTLTAQLKYQSWNVIRMSK